MTKPRESLDCVAVKQRAQRKLARALAGKPPEAQVELLQRLAAKTPLWKDLVEPRAKPAPKAVRPRGKRRSTA
jgi:hypothetical protein